MEKKCKLLTCDRCGNNIILKLTEEITKNGSSILWESYERAPEGWYWSPDLGMHLCPDCSAKYEQLMLKFKEEK